MTREDVRLRAATIAEVLRAAGYPVTGHSELDAGAGIGIAFELPNGRRTAIRWLAKTAWIPQIAREISEACREG